MEIYQVKSSVESTKYGLMARDAEGYCYVYSANTGLWQRDGECEIDFEFVREASYELVAVETAKRMLSEVTPVDRRVMERYVRRLEQQSAEWTLTSSEVFSGEL